MSGKLADYLSILVFLLVIATVFQQIATSLTEQGIASGGPYDNAASYPRSLAIIICILLAGYVASLVLARKKTFAANGIEDSSRPAGAKSVHAPASTLASDDSDSDDVSASRGAGLLLVFLAYLLSLPYLGYQLSTPLMLGAMLILGGMRSVPGVLTFSIAASVGVSFLFEVFLNIVLPGGVFSLNMPWPSF